MTKKIIINFNLNHKELVKATNDRCVKDYQSEKKKQEYNLKNKLFNNYLKLSKT